MVVTKKQLKPSARLPGVVRREIVTAMPTLSTARKKPLAKAPP
jgi:hypothetical protein